MSKLFDSLKDIGDQFKDLSVEANNRLHQTGRTIRFVVNPNHRHDEEHEKEADRIRTEIAESHRFKSFAPPREGNRARWFIDGHDYFYALSEALENAQESIYILDWWLSPELYLRRPPTKNEEWRLDRVLKRKAEQGVRIYVVVYKEVTQTMTMSSAHTKHSLMNLHENILVMRHPDHIGGDITLYYSHHSKVCIIDNRIAFVGGIDLCFGRWDTHNHPLADAHPTNFDRALFPGQDYNARILDFTKVSEYVGNEISILQAPRGPWHDIHSVIKGPSVIDLTQLFVERWNHIYDEKYYLEKKYHHLALPHNLPEDEPVNRHPHLGRWKEIGRSFKHPWSGDHENSREDFKDPQEPHRGTVNVQVLRSAGDWSNGILTEKSIQNAYIEMIREASHSIWIENQFFITAVGDGRPVDNRIGAAIVERILQSAKDKQKFLVTIVIPAVPGFAGDIQGAAGTKAIMHAQYASICRKGKSIMEVIRKAGVNPDEYIRFYNLHSYDRINYDRKLIREMEEKSGVSFHQAQVAQARVWLGEGEGPKDRAVFIQQPVGETSIDPQQMAASVDPNAKPQKKAVQMPATVEEARDVVNRFISAAPRDDQEVSDSVAGHALRDSTSLLDEQWLGSEEDEKNNFVTEQCYVHSKILIVDDRRVLIGSANINDRSMNGDRDSETALVFEDRDLVESKMDGQRFLAGRFATTFRRQLTRFHLGLIPPQPCNYDERVDENMRAYPNPNAYDFGSEEDKLVEDPLSDSFLELYRSTARKNTKIFEDVFHVQPTDLVRNWEDYKNYRTSALVGHVDPSLDLRYIKEQLAQVRGTLCEMPLHYLEDVDLIEGGLEVNPITADIYL